MQGSPPPVAPRLPNAVRGAALFLMVWGLAPFVIIANHFPWKIDAIKWVTRSASDRDWMQWVFHSTHFVGYRPVTAFSFTLNHAIAGWNPYVYRLTDLALHLGVSAATLALFVRLTGCTNWLALVPVAVLAGHPGIEETLPYLPRRSYTLAMLFGMLAVHQWLDGRWARKFLATALLLLSLLSNEIGYVALPMLPLLAWNHGVPAKRAVRDAVLPAIAVIPAVLMRFSVLGWAGGYTKHYFAYAKAGKKTLRQVEGFNGPEIVQAAFDYVFFPLSMGGKDPITTATVFALPVAAWLCWSLFMGPLLHSSDRARRLPLLLLIWMFGYAVLFGISRTWFWRQAYPMIVVLGLMMGTVAHLNWTHHRGWRRGALAGLQLLFLVGVFWHSAVVRGMTTSNLWPRFEGNAAIRSFDALLDEVDAPVTAYLILPLTKGSNRNVMTWMHKVRPEVRLHQLGTAKRNRVAATLEDGKLVLGDGTKLTKTWKSTFPNGVPLQALMAEEGTTGLLLPHGKGAWQWVELH